MPTLNWPVSKIYVFIISSSLTSNSLGFLLPSSDLEDDDDDGGDDSDGGMLEEETERESDVAQQGVNER